MPMSRRRRRERIANAKKQASKAVFIVRSAESRNGGSRIKGAAQDGARIGQAARSASASK